MKPSAFLVNVSRGAIVDEASLLRALQQRRIAGAALDVYSQEPLAKAGHPLSALYAMDNAIVFPHLTFFTREAMQRLEDETIERCFEILAGRHYASEVARSAPARPAAGRRISTTDSPCPAWLCACRCSRDARCTRRPFVPFL